MKALLLVVNIMAIALAPILCLAEEQVRDASGRVVEIRQMHGSTTYAYDNYRNPIYIAIDVPGGKGAVDYRNHYGIHVGMGVPGTARDFRGPWGPRPPTLR
jgi:YD repeat-containing protein